MSTARSTVGIVGVGLIGGSLGMCLSAKPDYQVVGWDVSSESLDTAVRIGAISGRSSDLRALCAESDVVVIATPISVALELLPTVLSSVRPDCVVTDVCSTKQRIVDLAVTCAAGDAAPVFIGGHPMAGSERQGISAADPYLFENALYVLTPPFHRWEENPRMRRAVETLSGLIKQTGARLAIIPPEEHDFMAAVVSHLPHVVAAALVETLDSYTMEYPSVSSMAAGGFRDVTRVASGNPELWTDILLSNAENVSETIHRFSQILSEFGLLLQRGSPGALAGSLERAAEIRSSIPQNLKGLTAPLHELVVAINDEPGKISSVTSLIAAEGINIKDIEILKIREGEGGTLRLGFSSPSDCEAAQSVLAANGYGVRRR
ncbi:MAG: prephenate dehydrogenase [Firmicutes bacterium]|nr:prephenate dehydrogenase [Bacillota bacterium]